MEMLLTTTAAITDTRQRLRLFSGATEIWILILPLLALPLFLAEQALGLSWTTLDWNISSFIVSSIGLSGIHNYFTIAMLFALPEVNSWRVEQVARHPVLFRLRTYGVSFVILVLTFIAYSFWQVGEVFSSLIGIGFTLVTAHHSFSQSLGLSQAYTANINSHQDLSFQERERFRRYQMIEIKLKKILVPLQFIWSATVFIPMFLKMPAITVELEWIRPIAMSLFLIVLGGFLINCFYISSLRPSNKFLFSLRMILFACASGSSSLALVFVLRLMHGIEYWGVFRSFTERSSATARQKKNLFWFTAALVVVALVLLLCRRGDGFYYYFAGFNIAETHWIVPLFGAFSLSMIHIHFFLDGLLFRMRDPISRKWIAPLLREK